jgi:hypothetical protein
MADGAHSSLASGIRCFEGRFGAGAANGRGGFSVFLTALALAWFASGAASAIDIDQGFQIGAADQPQINVCLSRTATGPALVSPDGTDPITGLPTNTINFQAFLDTGASGILFAKETATSFSLNTTGAVYSDVGVGGSQNFDVSEPLYVRLGANNPTNMSNLESPSIYTQQIGPVQMQVNQTNVDPLSGADPLNVVGTPAMQGKVVVMDSRKLNAVSAQIAAGADPITLLLNQPDDFSIRTYLYNPDKQFNPLSDSDPGIPAVNLHLKLSSASFNRFSTVTPTGAMGPTLANNPFIGPNPVAALDPHPPVDNTPKIKVSMGAYSAQGSFLLDTGAATSIISDTIAQQLNIFHQTAGDPMSPLVFNAPGQGSPLVPDQFQLMVTGVGGTVTRNGFYLDSLLAHTMEAKTSADNDPLNLRFLHVPVLVDDISVLDPVANVSLTLDGVLGMNLLTSTADPTNPLSLVFAPGAFDFATFDQTAGTLGLKLASTFFTHGDIDGDGSISVADVSALVKGLGDLTKLKSDRALTDADLTLVADMDGNGSVDNLDVQALIVALANSGGGSLSAVPEPSGVVLALVGATAMLIVAQRRGRA